MRKLVLLFCLVLTRAVWATPLSDWQARMLSYGQMNCNRLIDPNTTDDLLAQTYYDSEFINWKIFDYTLDPKWSQCAQYAEHHYRDGYVLPNNGGAPGYWTFSRGLAEDYKRTGDNTSKLALDLLAANASYCRGTASELGAILDPELSRETAYCLNLFTERMALGWAAPFFLTYRSAVLGHFNAWFVTMTAPRRKPFMVGLSAWALIRSLDVYPSDKYLVVDALTKAGDYLWANFWDSPTQSMRYVDNQVPGDGGPDPAPDLNLLIAGLYEWVYQQTGSIRFRDRGDLLFAGGVAGAWLGNGKQFNQNYFWSFDYVASRYGQVTPTPIPYPSPFPTSSPTPTRTATPSRTPTKTPVPYPTATRTKTPTPKPTLTTGKRLDRIEVKLWPEGTPTP